MSRLKGKRKGRASKGPYSPRKERKVVVRNDLSVRGSPWVKTIRERLMVEDLDLKKSFVGSTPSSKSNFKALPRQKRWRKKGNTLITKVEDLPHGWNAREPDLDPK
jgi:hypothetical protein